MWLHFSCSAQDCLLEVFVWVCFSTGLEEGRGALMAQREVCCVRGVGYKDSLFCPWRRVSFASRLICILAHCAGMLPLLLVGLYFPDKTQSFKGFWAFAILPSVFCLFFFSVPPSLSCPFPLFIFDPFSMLPISFLFLSLLSTLPLSPSPVCVGFYL